VGGGISKIFNFYTQHIDYGTASSYSDELKIEKFDDPYGFPIWRFPVQARVRLSVGYSF
jgi:hypothetical protein